MALEVIALGVGDAFSVKHHTSSLLLCCDGAWLGVDCPDRYREALESAARSSGRTLDLGAIDDMLVTHLHGDHVNGLEGIAFWKHFVEAKRLRLHLTSEARAEIWEHRLRAPMERLWDGRRFIEMTFDDYFDSRTLSWEEESNIGPFRVRIRRTQHHIPTAAIRVEAGGRSVGYSADTAFDHGLIEWLSAADLVIHETNFGPAHTSYESLATLPDSFRRRMRLIRYPDSFDVSASSIACIAEGEVLIP
jgi:ribonuclease BN (tRNA processing enzyme)